MRIIFIAAGFGFLCLHPLFAAPNPQPATAFALGTSTIAPLKTEDTRAFFKAFIAKVNPLPRGDFESREAYQKRLPLPEDAKKLVYLPAEILMPSLEKNFAYDIDTQMMTVIGGFEPYKDNRPHKPKGTKAMYIAQDFTDMTPYTGSNAYGGTATVSGGESADYIIDFHNARQWTASLYDNKTKHFAVSFPVSPSIGQELSKHLQIVLGVVPMGYSNSFYGETFRETPTFDNPNDFVNYAYEIEADLVSVSVIDTNTGMILKQIIVPASQAK